jgi:hypothetical protein
MAMWIVIVIIGGIVVLSIARLAWIMRSGEVEPGGSDGTQLFSRIGKKKRETTDDF